MKLNIRDKKHLLVWALFKKPQFRVRVEGAASLVVDVVGIALARPVGGGGDGGGVELPALRDLPRRHDDVPVQ